MKKAVKYTLLQKKLYDCLYYFLYSSIKETQLQGLLTRNRLSSNPLRQWCNTLHRTGFDREKYYNEKPFRAHISAKEYAAFLAELYSTWSSMVPKSDLRPKRLPDGKNYKDWLSSGGNGHKYWPVHSLKEKLGKVGNTFFLHGIVHGSICTLDDTDGFSDMDLAFIVRRDVLCDSGGLLELRKVAIEILAMSYCFDPYMHHGPYYISEVDLDFYPQGLLPSLLFEYGVTIYTDKKPIYFKPHTAKNFVDSLLENCLKYFSSLSKKEQCVENSWDIEVILGTAMILPALYLQRVTKQSQYKKHTFAPARIDFTEEEWEPIETATEVRNCLPKRYCPSKKMLQWAIRLRWPGLIQRRALNRPNEKKRVKFARERIGPNYPQKVIALIESIQRKIAHKDCEINLKVKKTISVYNNIFDNIPIGPYTDEPFKATTGDYVKAKAFLVEYWSSQSIKPISIYQLGSVGAPGHSDLDFIIVWPEGKLIPYEKFTANNFPSWLHPFLVHPPYFCTVSLWHELYSWYPTFDLEHVWGEELEQPELNESYRPGIALALLVDVFLTKMPEDLFYYAAKVPVRLRVVINTLHTLKYTVMLAELARIPVPSDTWQVVYDVDALRQKWWDFGEEKYKRLKNLCISACKVLQHILDNCVSLCQEICPTQSFDYSSVLDNGFIQKYSEKALSHYYETGVPLKMVHPGLIKVLSLYKELEPKLTPTLEKYGKLPKIQIKNNSIYMKGINKHVKEMTRYGDVMIPLGIPATKYYSLGYSPQNTKRTQSRQVAVMKKGKHFLKRLCQPTFYLRILDHLLSKAGI